MALSDLISVNYIDNTGYPAAAGNAECVGSVFWHYWGPARQLVYMRNDSFPTYYPNAPLAMGLQIPGAGTPTAVQICLHDWANLFQASITGAPYIEAYRGIGSTASPIRYAGFPFPDNATTSTTAAVPVSVSEDGSPSSFDATGLGITWRYPGIPPQSFGIGKNFKITFTRSTDASVTNCQNLFTMAVTCEDLSTPAADVVVETHVVSPDPNFVLDGSNVFIDNVLARDSQYFRSKCTFQPMQAGVYTIFKSGAGDIFSGTYSASSLAGLYLLGSTNDPAIATADEDAARKQFGRFEIARSTIILGATASTISGKASTWLSEVAFKRNNVHIFFGWDKGTIFNKSLSTATKTDITSVAPQPSAYGRWGTFYVAKEAFDSWAGRLYLNGIGTCAGATVAVAQAINRNQPASAQTYGAFPGILYDSVPFEILLETHDTSGIGGVYDAVTGPQIFNVRTLFSRQTSYFGKLNCMRVIEAILDRVIRACLAIIHTPTAADPMQRAIFSSTLSSILSDFMPNQILNDSYAAVSDAVNNDAATHGGEILYINLNLHLIKVVERVKIAVIATDSSITVQY